MILKTRKLNQLTSEYNGLKSNENKPPVPIDSCSVNNACSIPEVKRYQSPMLSIFNIFGKTMPLKISIGFPLKSTHSKFCRDSHENKLLAMLTEIYRSLGHVSYEKTVKNEKNAMKHNFEESQLFC